MPSVFAALGGMDAVAINATYSYAGDISHNASKRSASLRFLIIDTFIYLFMPVGIYCGDFIYQKFGYTWLFASVASLFGISAIYASVFLPNIIPHNEESHDCTEEEKSRPVKPLKILQDLACSLTRRRPQYGRGIIAILLLILGTHSISYTTDSNISYIYLQTKLGLSEDEISVILSVGLVITGIGNLVLMAVIQLTDINVMIIGLISCISELGYYLE